MQKKNILELTRSRLLLRELHNIMFTHFLYWLSVQTLLQSILALSFTFSGPVSKRTCPTTGGPQQTKYRSSASHPPNPMTSMCPGTIKTMLIERIYSLVNFDQDTSIIYFLTCHFSRLLLSNVNTECLVTISGKDTLKLNGLKSHRSFSVHVKSSESC